MTLFVYTSPKIISTQKEQQVTFTCNAFGSPRPIITWRRSHGTLSASRTLTTDGNLSIMNVTIGDSGFYVCNATSAEQKNSSSVELKVFYSLAHVLSPEFSVTLYVGQALKLSCPTSSGTELWLYNGSVSVPQDACLETPGILLIPSLRKDHLGNYSCLSGDSLQWNVSLHVKFPETCSIVKQSICDASGDYVIDPDGELGEDPFTVYCNMTDKGGVGVTVVSHDSESRILVKGPGWLQTRHSLHRCQPLSDQRTHRSCRKLSARDMSVIIPCCLYIIAIIDMVGGCHVMAHI